jgi:hypothetical protein
MPHAVVLASVSSRKSHFTYAAFRPPLLVRFPEGNQVLYAPEPIPNASGHGRRHAKCTMKLDEIVGKMVEGAAA